MSADYYISDSETGDAINLNITYNLTGMLREAGYPPHKAMTGAPCSEAGGIARRTADRLRADPDKFRAMNPPNGWGTYEWALDFLDHLADACARNPIETIGTWL